MTAFSVIVDCNDWYSVWRLRIISDKSFIANESLLTRGLFLIQLSMWKFINRGSRCGGAVSSGANWTGPLSC
jgi:hypothetical protein